MRILGERGEYSEEPAGARLALVDVEAVGAVAKQSRIGGELLATHTHAFTHSLSVTSPVPAPRRNAPLIRFLPRDAMHPRY